MIEMISGIYIYIYIYMTSGIYIYTRSYLNLLARVLNNRR